ncbi:MAG: CRISPR-associated endonuclease Cas3'' [Deferrisomatales bacterium]
MTAGSDRPRRPPGTFATGAAPTPHRAPAGAPWAPPVAEPPSLAHVAEDGRVHPLADHLAGTAERAARFAAAFGCAAWGYLAGLWHDLGKYSPAFQRRLGRARTWAIVVLGSVSLARGGERRCEGWELNDIATRLS